MWKDYCVTLVTVVGALWHQKMRKTTGAWFCVSVLSFLAWELWFIPALNFCSFLKFPRLAFRGRFFSASTQCSTWSLYLCKCITFSCTRGLTSTKTRWRIRRKNCIHTIHMQKISYTHDVGKLDFDTYLDLGKEDFLGESPLTDEVWGVPAIRYPPYLDILLMYILIYVYFHPDIEKSVQ